MKHDMTSTVKSMAYHLADALKLKLGLKIPKGEGDYELKILDMKGHEYKINSQWFLKVTPVAKASYVSDNLLAILIKVRGDLFMYVTYVGKIGVLVAFVIDAGELPMTPQLLKKLDGLHPKQAKEILQPAVKAMYRRLTEDDVWQKYDDKEEDGEAVSVDAGQARPGEKAVGVPVGGAG